MQGERMRRYNSSGSTNHRCVQMANNWYRISWTVDFYYSGQRCRFPRRFERDTGRKGAERFAKKWDIEIRERA